MEIEKLQSDLSKDIGTKDSTKAERIKNYRKRARLQEYGGKPLPIYNEKTLTWAQEAIEETWTTLVKEMKESLCIIAKGLFQREPIMCCWKKDKPYQTTDWYKFLEAVKNHQEAGSAILKEYGIG